MKAQIQLTYGEAELLSWTGVLMKKVTSCIPVSWFYYSQQQISYQVNSEDTDTDERIHVSNGEIQARDGS